MTLPQSVLKAANELIEIVLAQVGGYLSGPGFEAAEKARALKAALAELPAPEQAKHAVGDWRPVRDALEYAYKMLPRFEGPNGYPAEDWNLALYVHQYVTERTHSCMHCQTQFKLYELYRCFDCKGFLCERCAVEHFGPKHAERARAAHPEYALSAHGNAVLNRTLLRTSTLLDEQGRAPVRQQLQEDMGVSRQLDDVPFGMRDDLNDGLEGNT